MGVVSGGGGGAAFNGGTITNTLTVDPPSGSEGVVVAGVDGNTTKLLDLSALHTVFTVDSDGTVLYTSDDQPLLHIEGIGSQAILTIDDDQNLYRTSASSTLGLRAFYAGGQIFAVNSGIANGGRVVTGVLATSPPAPATAALASGTGAQLSTARDTHSYTPVTFNPTAGAAATCAVAISPDNVTYYALYTETEPAGLAFDGTIHGLNVYVPGTWYLKLTVTNATIGTTTYY